jgi:hypothetical protein
MMLTPGFEEHPGTVSVTRMQRGKRRARFGISGLLRRGL